MNPPLKQLRHWRKMRHVVRAVHQLSWLDERRHVSFRLILSLGTLALQSLERSCSSQRFPPSGPPHWLKRGAFPSMRNTIAYSLVRLVLGLQAYLFV